MSHTPHKRAYGAPWGPWSARTPSLCRGAPAVSIPHFCQVTHPWRSKMGRPPDWLRRENFHQGLGFCNFRPGKLQPHGNIHVSSARPPIVFSVFFSFWGCAEPIWGSPPGPTRGRLTPLGRASVGPPLYWPSLCGIYEETGVSGTRTPTPKRAVTPGPVPMSPQVSHTPSKEGSRGLCIVSQDPPLKTHLTAGFMRKWVLNWGSLRVRQPASLGLKLGC